MTTYLAGKDLAGRDSAGRPIDGTNAAPAGRRARIMAGALTLAALAATPGHAEAPGAAQSLPAKAAAVIVTRAASICFSALVRTTGYLVPRSAAAVMFNAPNFRVSEISAKEGDKVTEGQQLAVLVPKDTPIGSESQAPGSFILKAPVTGSILRSSAKIGGTTSTTGEPFFTLAVGGEIEAQADIPSIHVLEINPGQTARVSLDDGREFGGHVRLVPVEINRKTQAGTARISVENEPSLKAGTFAHVAIDASRSCGIAVPRAALIQASDGTSVQVVKDQTISTRMVHLGLLSDTDAEISDGVAEGELVVANAGTSLRDGDKVRPIYADLQEVR